MRRLDWALFVATIPLVVLTSSLVTIGAIYRLEPWNDPNPQTAILPAHVHSGEEISLNWDTPVTHRWITADGERIGAYTTTLHEYHDLNAAVAAKTRFREDLSAVVGHFATDPTTRQHLLDHDVSRARLDTLARIFPPDPEVEAYLAFTE